MNIMNMFGQSMEHFDLQFIWQEKLQLSKYTTVAKFLFT